MLIALLVFACLATEVVPRETDYCYANVGKPYVLTGAKTPYQFVHGGNLEHVTVPNCEPVQIWVLIRHGTRYPGKDEIQDMETLPRIRDQILNNHEAGRGRLCDTDLENLRKWKLAEGIKRENAKVLTKEGEMDLSYLGARFRNNYPELLQLKPEEVTARNYKFRSTDTQRTIRSMTSFIRGVFGNPTTINFTEVVPTEQDALLKAYATCKPWQESVDGPSAKKEIDELMNGPEYEKMTASVSRRLGFPNNITLHDINTLYQACRFENAFMAYKLMLSPWCAVFNEDEMRLLEYEEDLFYYYHSGYGGRLSKAVGCMPLQDMYNRFEALEDSDHPSQPKGVFYFTHSTAVQTFHVSMGLYRDVQPLKAANFRRMANREWRTSNMSPFAMNVAAIFYKCNTTSKHKVVFRAAERNLFLEDCDNGVCDWEFIKKRVRSTAANCSLEFCKSNAAPTQQSSFNVTPILSSVLLSYATWRSQLNS